MTGIAETTPVQIASLYAGDLNSDVNEQTLWNVFSPFGQVISVKICRDSQTNNSLGYAYINFRTSIEAEKAMQSVNFTPIDGRPCRVMWSMRDANRRKLGIGNLLVKNIDQMFDSKLLYDAFSAFGQVLSCKLAVDEYGLTKGYGFVQYYNEKDAEEARLKSDGVVLFNKKLIVTKFIARGNRTDAKPVNPNDFTNVFVKNFRDEWNVEDLKSQFSRFGEISSCVITKDALDKPIGYGFVNYTKPEFAALAVEKMNGFELPSGQKLFAGKAMKKQERTMFLKKQYDIKRKEYCKQFENLNLYIKNFDESMTEDKLKEHFSKFGKILSCHIMRDEYGKFKGFGFVCFSTADEAQAALVEMNGKLISEKPLFVSLAQSKEERKKLIEQRTYNQSFRGPMFTPGAVPFMYPPPAQAMPYAPHQYQRYQSQTPKNQGRQIQQTTNQSYSSQNQRQNYLYQNGSYNQHNYKQRSNTGQARHHNQGQVYNQRQQGSNHNTHNTVQHTATDVPPASRTKREEVKVSNKAQTQIQDNRVVFKDNLFRVCQKTFMDNKLDMSLLSRISSTVIDYYSDSYSNSKANLGDKDFSETVINAYKSFQELEAKANNGVQHNPEN